MSERFRTWVLVSGSRYWLASGLVGVMTVLAVAPVASGFVIRNTSPLIYMASALLGANITLITVTVAIHQVILSQELEPPGSLEDEIERTAEYRQSALGDRTPPTRPANFV